MMFTIIVLKSSVVIHLDEGITNGDKEELEVQEQNYSFVIPLDEGITNRDKEELGVQEQNKTHYILYYTPWWEDHPSEFLSYFSLK